MALDTWSRETGIQKGRTPANCQGLGMDFRDLQGGRKEGFPQIKNQKTTKTHCILMVLDTWIQTGRIPGSCQSLGMDFRDCKEAAGREALQALCYFCGSPRQAAQLTVTHGGILPGIINPALLTAPWAGEGKFGEVTGEPREPKPCVPNPPEHPQQPQCCICFNKASANTSHSIVYHFSGH